MDTRCLLAQPKEGQQFKNKKQPEPKKIELYGSPTTQEIKKKHSSRPVGGAETSTLGRKDSQQGSRWWTQPGGGLWNRVDKAAAGRQGSSWGTRWQTSKPRVPAWGHKASNHWLKTPVGVEAAAGETPGLTGEFIGETHSGLECAQAHLPANHHQRGPVWLWVAEGVTEIRQRVEQVALLPIRPLSHKQCHRAATNVTLPRWTPKALPLYITGTPRQKKWPKWKNRSKLQKKYN